MERPTESHKMWFQPCDTACWHPDQVTRPFSRNMQKETCVWWKIIMHINLNVSLVCWKQQGTSNFIAFYYAICCFLRRRTNLKMQPHKKETHDIQVIYFTVLESKRINVNRTCMTYVTYQKKHIWHGFASSGVCIQMLFLYVF